MELELPAQPGQDSIEATVKESTNENYFKIKKLGKTIFTKAKNQKQTVYLLGQNVIAEAKTPWEEIKLDFKLQHVDTKTLIPIISAMILELNKNEQPKFKAK